MKEENWHDVEKKLKSCREYRNTLFKNKRTDLLESFPYFFAHPKLVIWTFAIAIATSIANCKLWNYLHCPFLRFCSNSETDTRSSTPMHGQNIWLIYKILYGSNMLSQIFTHNGPKKFKIFHQIWTKSYSLPRNVLEAWSISTILLQTLSLMDLQWNRFQTSVLTHIYSDTSIERIEKFGGSSY